MYSMYLICATIHSLHSTLHAVMAIKRNTMHFLHGGNLQFTATVGDNNAGHLNGVTLSHAESAATSSAINLSL
ncbi:hypothetical protein L218DRAFT_1059337 [Marasmius fiardii PR-910]|nr:hypothetical protein L218DRAFT_1059337 [Marasmius fiardii PR-910]